MMRKHSLIAVIMLLMLLFGGCGSAPPQPTKAELAALQAQVAADEQNYTDYQSFDQYDYIYSGAPERLWFKPADEDWFYCWQPADADFSRLLRAAEDRMHYSALEDYNLWCFSPDSISTMGSSGHRYLVFDYDNGEITESDPGYRHDIIFNFPESTRLFRLARLLSYSAAATPAADMSDFTAYSGVSGYDYMVRLPQQHGLWQSEQQQPGFSSSGEPVPTAISAATAADIAVAEAQKPCYQYQGWKSDFYLPDGAAPQLIFNADTLYVREEWRYEALATAHLLWEVRLFDANDPLTSLCIYIDAESGAVAAARDLSD